MVAGRYSRVILLSAVAMLCFAFTVSAQDGALGALTVGQPIIAQLSAEVPTARFSYAAEVPQQAMLQAFGETAQPTITVFHGGEVIASEANAAGGLIVNLPVLLSGGVYTVEVGTANDTSGAVIVVVQNVEPVPLTDLAPASITAAEVSASVPLALFRVVASEAASYLYVDSGLQTGGPLVALVNESTGVASGVLGGDLLGGRFNLAANTAYRVEVTHSGQHDAEPMTLCWVPTTSQGCGEAPVAAEEAAAPEVPAQTAACTVTASTGAVNVRASASTNAAIISTLAAGVAADVIGIAPGGAFYNIQLGGVNGWVAASVVVPNGDCSSVQTVQPPPVQPVSTQPPAQPQPTQAPVQPTQPPQPEPPQPQPTQPPSGPCLLTLNSAVNVYTQPTAQIDFLQDQVGAGGELIPTGRLADNSWWQTNYGGAWVQTGLIGSALTQSGNCGGLPVVSP